MRDGVGPINNFKVSHHWIWNGLNIPWKDMQHGVDDTHHLWASDCPLDTFPIPVLFVLFVVHYLQGTIPAGRDRIDGSCSSPPHVRSPPCLYRSAKQIKALSQITYPRYLHNSRTRAAEAITVKQSKCYLMLHYIFLIICNGWWFERLEDIYILYTI